MSTPTADVGGPGDPTRVVVGRAGRAHGVTGEISVRVLTDDPGLRFAAGARVTARLPAGGTRVLEVQTARTHGDRLLVRFAGVTDRTAAEGIGGSDLSADVAAGDTASDPEDFFDHQLVGLAAVDTGGAALGGVIDVLHHASQDLLVVEPIAGGEDVLVPFVTAIVLTVDVRAGRVVLDPPGGLFGDPPGGLFGDPQAGPDP